MISRVIKISTYKLENFRLICDVYDSQNIKTAILDLMKFSSPEKVLNIIDLSLDKSLEVEGNIKDNILYIEKICS